MDYIPSLFAEPFGKSSSLRINSSTRSLNIHPSLTSHQIQKLLNYKREKCFLFWNNNIIMCSHFNWIFIWIFFFLAINKFQIQYHGVNCSWLSRSQSLCNRSFWWRFYVVTLLFGFFSGCRVFFHMTESDLFLFLFVLKFDFKSLNCFKKSLFIFQLLGECHCWWTRESPRAHVAKFYDRLRLICSV